MTTPPLSQARELFAPGKLFVFGEWSVLEGSPALLAPTDAGQRATLTWTEALELGWDAPDHQAAPRRWRWEPPGWREITSPGHDPLDLVSATLREAALAGFAPQRGVAAQLVAEGMQARDAAGRTVKLGFGSSAAACALAARTLASVGAAPAAPNDLLQLAFAAHRRAQQGRGSGADVAVALLDADVGFQLDAPTGLRPDPAATPPAARAEPLERPQQLFLLAAWTGQAADTRALIDAMEAWRSRAPASYAAALAHVADAAEAGSAAWRRGDAAAVLDAAAGSAAALAALGDASGVPIVIEAHRRIDALVRASCPGQGLAKPSGAGGGDMALVLLRGPEAAQAAAQALQAGGFAVFPLTPRPACDHPRAAHLSREAAPPLTTHATPPQSPHA